MAAGEHGTTSTAHLPVMPAETLQGWLTDPDGIYVDATFGRGGHSGRLLQQLGPGGVLLAIDRDPDAVRVAQAMASSYSSEANTSRVSAQMQVEHADFAQLAALIEARGWKGRVNGILFDLGVSSPQLDTAGRGFSFMRDGELDMRMDNTRGETAAEWLARVSEDELRQVIGRLGEERYAKKIAMRICQTREEAPLQRTSELAELVADVVPAERSGGRNKKARSIHPATKTFQAIRMHINNELQQLTDVLPAAVDVLAPEGRLAVISFHSLEDRIVKRFYREQSRGAPVPKGLPVRDEEIEKPLKLVDRAIKASDEEVQRNARARSAVLRVAAKR